MQIVCIYCQKVIGEKDGNGVLGVSHGVCQECLEKLQPRVWSPVDKDSKETKKSQPE